MIYHEVETTLLCSCLALFIVSCFLPACPLLAIFVMQPKILISAVRKVLESIESVPLSDWSWLKASLPSSHDDFNLRSDSLTTPLLFWHAQSAQLFACRFSPPILINFVDPHKCYNSFRLAVFGCQKIPSISVNVKSPFICSLHPLV